MEKKLLVLVSLLFLAPLVLYAATPEKSPAPACLDCHPDKGEGKVVHPAIAMGCESCHVGTHAGEKPAPKQSAPVPELCFTCHDKKAMVKAPAHVSAAGGQCLTCHNPHAADAAFLLTAVPENHCVSCHEDMTPRHVMARVSPNDTHPLKGRPDPLRKGKELTCASCHNPHASDRDRLSTKGLKSPAALCARCHTKIMARP